MPPLHNLKGPKTRFISKGIPPNFVSTLEDYLVKLLEKKQTGFIEFPVINSFEKGNGAATMLIGKDGEEQRKWRLVYV